MFNVFLSSVSHQPLAAYNVYLFLFFFCFSLLSQLIYIYFYLLLRVHPHLCLFVSLVSFIVSYVDFWFVRSCYFCFTFGTLVLLLLFFFICFASNNLHLVFVFPWTAVKKKTRVCYTHFVFSYFAFLRTLVRHFPLFHFYLLTIE